MVEYPRTPAAAAHGRGMAATLAVMQLDDVTYRGSSDASSHTVAANLVITFVMLVPVSSEAALFACQISELPTVLTSEKNAFSAKLKLAQDHVG